MALVANPEAGGEDQPGGEEEEDMAQKFWHWIRGSLIGRGALKRKMDSPDDSESVPGAKPFPWQGPLGIAERTSFQPLQPAFGFSRCRQNGG
jgi:hypothetical protein